MNQLGTTQHKNESLKEDQACHCQPFLLMITCASLTIDISYIDFDGPDKENRGTISRIDPDSTQYDNVELSLLYVGGEAQII